MDKLPILNATADVVACAIPILPARSDDAVSEFIRDKDVARKSRPLEGGSRKEFMFTINNIAAGIAARPLSDCNNALLTFHFGYCPGDAGRLLATLFLGDADTRFNNLKIFSKVWRKAADLVNVSVRVPADSH